MKWLTAIAAFVAVSLAGVDATQSPSDVLTQVDPAAARALLEGFERSESRPSRFGSIQTFLDSLDKAAPSWIAEAPEGTRERRRHLVALLVLETARDRTSGADVGALVGWGCDFLRRGEPSDFERTWMLASLAIYQESRPSGPRGHTRHARSRFPADPRLLLAEIAGWPEAFVVTNRPGADPSRLARGLEDGRVGGSPTPRGLKQIRETRDELTKLANDPTVGAEARARLGLLLFHLNELPASAEHSASAERASDAALRHFSSLNAGLALDALNRSNDAIAAYRRATVAVPGARSSALALAAALFVRGERDEAASLVDDFLSRSPMVLDPWHRLPLGRYRFSALADELRRMVGLPAAVTAPTQPISSVARPRPPASTAGAATPVESPSLGSGRLTFRGGAATGVVVDVSVMDGRRPVLGLTPRDFEVLDDGVPQRVNTTGVAAVPIDVTLVVDTAQESYAFKGQDYRNDAEQGVRDIPGIIKLLRPADRLRVLNVNNDVSEAFALQTVDSSGTRVDLQWSTNIAGALFDGVATALLRPTPSDRRHLVVIFTDGVDSSSVVTAARLRAIAAQVDPLIQLARRFTADELFRQKDPRATAWLERRFLWPPEPTLIEDIVRSADGEVRHAQPGESMVTDVGRVIDRFRQSYLLYFEPTGVPPSGWHALTVRVKKPGRFDVKARRGYYAGPPKAKM
jgi:tetratricopeptide (TPR) repeat protein